MFHLFGKLRSHELIRGTTMMSRLHSRLLEVVLFFSCLTQHAARTLLPLPDGSLVAPRAAIFSRAVGGVGSAAQRLPLARHRASAARGDASSSSSSSERERNTESSPRIVVLLCVVLRAVRGEFLAGVHHPRGHIADNSSAWRHLVCA